jgi:hypothetical protein
VIEAVVITPGPDVAPELACEFPSVRFSVASSARLHAGAPPAVSVRSWLEVVERDGFAPFDVPLRHASESGTLFIDGDDAGGAAVAAYQILTRYQRLVMRRNAAASGPLFDAVLAAHRELHVSPKPLVVADFHHALDTWQWLLRIAPDASLALQIAALYHDVERLVSEADVRIEHTAPDYQAFKDAHARKGAELTRHVLDRVGVPRHVVSRACALLAAHERRGEDPDLRLLNDADALSFFSLNSPGYVDYFGVEQARKKVAYTLARLDRARWPLLGRVRLRRDVRALLEGALSQAAAASHDG